MQDAQRSLRDFVFGCVDWTRAPVFLVPTVAHTKAQRASTPSLKHSATREQHSAAARSTNLNNPNRTPLSPEHNTQATTVEGAVLRG